MTEQVQDDVIDVEEAPEPVGHDLVVRQSHTDVPVRLDEMERMADALSRSGVIPQHLVGKPGNLLAVMVASKALDIPLWQAMQELVPIKGRIGLSAALMRALVRKAGHKFRVVEREADHATVRIIRRDDPEPFTATFTIDDAVDAGLAVHADNGRLRARAKSGEILPWEAYTKAMLVARATGIVAREACPEALMGLDYTSEELGVVNVDAEGRVLEGRFSSSPAAAAPRLSIADAHMWLTDIEVAAGNEEKLRDIWNRAKDRALLEHMVEDTSLGQCILAARTPATAATVDAETAPAAPTPVVPEADDDPDEAFMRCGCDKAEFKATGQHLETCARYTATVAPKKKGGEK